MVESIDMRDFAIDFSKNSIWFGDKPLSGVFSGTILPMIFDILINYLKKKNKSNSKSGLKRQNHFVKKQMLN